MIKSSGLYKYTKKLFRDSLHSLGFDVVRYDMHNSEEVLLKTIINHYRIQTILDIGANEGQYAKALYEQGYQGKIHSFEPIASVFEKLKNNAKNTPGWSVHNLGVGSTEEEMMINVSENFVSSSILPVGKESLEAEAKTRVVRQEKIRITTVDRFLAANPIDKKDLLLKLDVQGYELEALKGADNALDDVRYVQTELSFIPVYDGAPLFQEIVEHLANRNFEIFTIIPGFRDSRTGRLLQADGFFVKKGLIQAD